MVVSFIMSKKCYSFLSYPINSNNKKAHGLKAQPLKDFILGSSPKCEQKIANTHPNKCKHPPAHSKLLASKVYF